MINTYTEFCTFPTFHIHKVEFALLQNVFMQVINKYMHVLYTIKNENNRIHVSFTHIDRRDYLENCL
jgi:hypothetical protein